MYCEDLAMPKDSFDKLAEMREKALEAVGAERKKRQVKVRSMFSDFLFKIT